MSKEAAKRELIGAVTNILKVTGDYRENLNKEVHIMDLSKDNLIIANGIKSDEIDTFTEAYNEFIKKVSENTIPGTNVRKAIATMASDTSRGSIFVNKRYLVNKNFDTSRSILTNISRAIPNNIYFGQSYRAREYSEYEAEKDIGTKKNLKEIAGKAFLIDIKKASMVVGTEVQGTKEVIYSWKDTEEKFDYIAYKAGVSEDFTVREIVPNDIGRQLLTEKGEIVVYEQGNKRAVIFDQRVLSKLDVGHIFSSRTPLKQKFIDFQKRINSIGLGDYKYDIQKIIDDAQQELIEKHGNIKIRYHNITDKNKNVIGVVTVTPQLYKVNAELAKIEAEKLREVIDKIRSIAINIPGSNTIKQDLIQRAIEKPLKALGIKTKKISGHAPVNISVDLPSLKVKQDKKNLVQSRTKKSEIKSKPLSIRTISGQFYSLASLQTLLDGSLIDRVKQNMGKGDRRDILNLRSGRFAESVKVEKLSQSREGMITAFYSYMKNPYATFSQGGRQSSPKTRDPKLLIARSIREIAASVVSNRMRLVPV